MPIMAYITLIRQRTILASTRRLGRVCFGDDTPYSCIAIYNLTEQYADHCISHYDSLAFFFPSLPIYFISHTAPRKVPSSAEYCLSIQNL